MIKTTTRNTRTAALRYGLLLAFAGVCLCLFGNPTAISGPGTLPAALAAEEPKAGTVSDFMAQPRHKAVRLSWKATVPDGQEVTFEIHRSMLSPDAEYTRITSLEGKAGSEIYRYTDKDIPTEENYFYKIVIPQTKESFGPLQARPPFSLPST